MSENIEKAETTETTANDNVVLYPVTDTVTADTSVAEPSNDTEVNIAQSATTDVNATKTDNTASAQSSQADQDAQNSQASQNNPSSQEAYDNPDDDLEEDFYEQQEASRKKDEHPFREFFSNFRSKRKIEMNRDEQILSRISDDDLMEYLRMEQRRMELLQQAKEVREKRFWTTFQIFICLLSVVLIIYFLKDSPVILVTILYTLGILAALRIWSKSQNQKDSSDRHKHSEK